MILDEPAPRMREIICTSRNLAEYCAMFGVTGEEFLRVPVLDCPGGASSFNIELRERGGRAVSADPAYGKFSFADFTELLPLQRASHLGRSRSLPGVYDHSWAGSLQRQEAMWSTAAEKFLSDYQKHPPAAPDSPYVTGSLPKLPFPDKSFGLVLSGHLLFSYPEHFNLTDHFTFLVELVRVARDDGEVRVHPLVDSIGADYPQLDTLREMLSRVGISTSIIEVAYQLHRGGNRTLICKRDPKRLNL